MKKNICIAVAAIAVALGGSMAAAQSTSAPVSGSQRDSSGSGKVTVSGCVQSADGSSSSSTSSSTSSSSRSSSGGDKFVLANATMGPATSSSSSSSRTESSASAGGSNTYKLEGKTSEVRQHVNHQVEITGRLESSSSGAARTQSGNSTRSSNDSPSAAEQELHVDSVRMISATCSR
jgi:endoglucanase